LRELPEPRKMNERLLAVHGKTRWRVLAFRAMFRRPLVYRRRHTTMCQETISLGLNYCTMGSS
jgi:hypothetical protein